MSDKPQHTPGPWAAGNPSEVFQGGISVYGGATGEVIADVWPQDGEPDQVVSNAALIAASPLGLKLARAVLAPSLVLATSTGSDVPCFDEYDREVESQRKGTAILDLETWEALRQLAELFTKVARAEERR